MPFVLRHAPMRDMPRPGAGAFTPRGGAGSSGPTQGDYRVLFSRLFIMRPVGTTLMALAFMVAGLFAYRTMPVADLPNISVPVIYIIATQPGSSPQQLASAVTTPLERRLGSIAGVSSIRSTTTDSSVFILLFFDSARDINGAARDVEAGLRAARADMPTTLLICLLYTSPSPRDRQKFRMPSSA